MTTNEPHYSEQTPTEEPQEKESLSPKTMLSRQVVSGLRNFDLPSHNDTPGAARHREDSERLICQGANVRSIVAGVNLYSIKKLLTDTSPDLLLLNETWHQDDSAVNLQNQNYNILLSPTDGRRGGGVAIISKSSLLVVPIFPELHTRNFLLARLSSRSANPILLSALYAPPDPDRHAGTMAHFIRTIEFLEARYASFSLLCFADLNVDVARSKDTPVAKDLIRALEDHRLHLKRSTTIGDFTRKQGEKESYLDYFLVRGAETTDVELGPRVGNSDHRLISCRLHNPQPILRKRQLIFSKKIAKTALHDLLHDGHMNELLKRTPVQCFRSISSLVKKRCVVAEPQPTNYFKANEFVDAELSTPNPNWKRVRNIISRCRGLELVALMEKLKGLRRDNRMSEFHRMIGNLLRLKVNANSVRELCDPADKDLIVYNPDRIREILSRKYTQLFASDTPRRPFAVGYIEPTSREEIEEAIRAIKCNKGLGIDCISDSIFNQALDMVMDKIVRLANDIFRRGRIPSPFKFARLHLINKLKAGLPTTEDLRPIMISSPIIKLLESIALIELKEKIECKIGRAQVGFLPELSTQTHILRLLGKLMDLKTRPTFKPGRWYVLFIDFRAAFDKVDHETLLSKMSDYNISERTMNIVRMLYNNYHFTISGSSPHKINSGVAQGSLISPLLYDLYINDLIETLSRELGADNVFAYADDIALLCLGYSDIRRSLGIVETWAKANKAEINRKKCGILKLTNRALPIKRKELGGIPFVREYKYLGVPLDQALTLKHLHTLISNKVKKFTKRINIISHSVLGLRSKLNIWQTYTRCLFDYFCPAIALCNQILKFSVLYTKSLKKALMLPQSTSSERLLYATQMPSPLQIAGHHIDRVVMKIKERFGTCPESLNSLHQSLEGHAREYSNKRERSLFSHREGDCYYVDLLAEDDEFFEKSALGLITGTFLTIRNEKGDRGEVGTIKSCPVCAVPATQTHFLNCCPANTVPRNILMRSLHPSLEISLLKEGNIFGFYLSLRSLDVKLKCECPTLSNRTLEEGLTNLGRSASAMAGLFVVNALLVFDQVRLGQERMDPQG